MCDGSAKPQNIAGQSWQLKRIFLVCKLPDLELGQIVLKEARAEAKSSLACFLISCFAACTSDGSVVTFSQRRQLNNRLGWGGGSLLKMPLLN